jgi:hypothetical protein
VGDAVVMAKSEFCKEADGVTRVYILDEETAVGSYSSKSPERYRAESFSDISG